jgi:hypothetical protein
MILLQIDDNLQKQQISDPKKSKKNLKKKTFYNNNKINYLCMTKSYEVTPLKG